MGLFKNLFGNKQPKSKTIHLKIDDAYIASHDAHAIVQPLYSKVDIYNGEARYEQDMAQFSSPQRYVFAMDWYTAEINNGGHDQFYFNSTGVVWEDAVKGFEAIGASDILNIIKESVARMGGAPNKDRAQRQEQLEKLEPDFEDLDSAFYEAESDLEALLLDYIKRNAKDFYFTGDLAIAE